MNFTSAENMKKHLKLNMPSMKGFHIANVYMLGSVLSGWTTGKLLGQLVVSCWESNKAPVFVLNETVLKDSVMEALAEITSDYSGVDQGIYFADVRDRETKERIVREINGAYRVWFVSLGENQGKD